MSNFAKLARITRRALHHYDSIGLLTPLSRGENNYRYYSTGQLAVVNLIRTLQESGLALDEIKDLRDKRTPEQTDALLTQLMGEIDRKVIEMLRSKQLLLTLTNSIRSAVNVDEEAVTIQSLPAEAIILGERNDYSNGRNDFDALFSFYNSINEKYLDLNLNYPVWAVFSEDRIKRGDWKWPDRYYFYNPDGRDTRPAALYAVGYQRGGYGRTDELYKRLIDYIDSHGFEICGDAYEEYPLNEICISDDANYLKRVMISVREKTGGNEGGNI
jgi:DNA-binding transcriptional MerR regulator/effector-binding domain-containing protein